MLAVNDMFMMSQPRVAGFFWEDVRDFLDAHDVRYASRIKLTGKSGFDHGVDFLIPHSKLRPERIVQVINAPSKNSIGAYLFSLGDTREARARVSEAYAALNDQSRAFLSPSHRRAEGVRCGTYPLVSQGGLRGAARKLATCFGDRVTGIPTKYAGVDTTP